MADSPRTGAEGVFGLQVKTDGAAIPDFYQVISAHAEEGVGQMPEAVLRLAAGDVAEGEFPEAEGSVFEEGKAITIAGSYGDGGALTFFEGVIVGKRMRITMSRGPVLEVIARDKAVAMMRVKKTTLFQQQKDSDVINAILSDHGLTTDVTATQDVARDQIQHDMTDWDFLRSVAERNGQIVYVAAGKVHVGTPDTSGDPVLTCTLGDDILEFDARIDAQFLASTAKGRAWDSKTQETVEGVGGALPSSTWGNVTPSNLAKTVVERELAFATSRELAAAELKTMSDARLTRSVLSGIQGRCRFQGSNKAQANSVLELKNLGKRYEGKAYISAVTHKAEKGQWETTATLGLPETFVADGPSVGGGVTQGLASPIHGLHIGKVQQLAEDPDGLLRIKVLLPLITAEGAPVWARYAQPYASNNAGIQFMPEIDDEVLVAFLNADPHAPVVIGSLHSATAAQPNAPTDDNFIKSIVTREDMKILFDEEKKIITVSTPGGHSVVMDDDAAEVKISDSNGNTITMGSSGIKIDSAGSIEVTAASTVDIGAGSDATISGVNVTCDASASFKGSGGASAALEGGGEAKVTGGVVMIN